MKHKRLISSGILIIVLLSVLSPTSVLAWHPTPSSYDRIFEGDSSFYNYDFLSNDHTLVPDPGDPLNDACDFPITLVFTDGSSYGDICNLYGSSWPASSMYNFVQSPHWEGGHAQAVGDSGIKLRHGFWPDDFIHMRVYPAVDMEGHLYCTRFGFYNVASTHKDRRELSLFPEYGWSEDASEWFASNSGKTVYWDYWDIGNVESYRWERKWVGPQYATHIWQSDGKVNIVRMDT